VQKSGTAEVPSSIDDVTAKWLTELLGTDVTDVRAEQIAEDSGFSSLLYRVHITGAVAPSTVIVKLPAQPQARGAMQMLDGYQRELSFYQRVAGRAPIQTPHVYAARMGKDSADFVLVLEDLRNRDNADHLAGLSIQRARLCMTQLAGLHAWSLEASNDDVVQTFPSLDTSVARDIFCPHSRWDGRSTASSARCQCHPWWRATPSVRRARTGGLAGAYRAIGAAAWRHQGGQHVL
jgi:Ecdysteroid kinase-like family